MMTRGRQNLLFLYSEQILALGDKLGNTVELCKLRTEPGSALGVPGACFG